MSEKYVYAAIEMKINELKTASENTPMILML